MEKIIKKKTNGAISRLVLLIINCLNDPLREKNKPDSTKNRGIWKEVITSSVFIPTL